MATNPVLRQRILAMRRLFRKYGEHIGAISLVGQQEPGKCLNQLTDGFQKL
jgi:hypothetical protein